jgi:hypothetical protein
MHNGTLSLPIAFLAGGLLSLAVFQSSPVATLSGQTDCSMSPMQRGYMEPGSTYVMTVDRRMKVPDWMKPVPCGSIKQGFFHDGKCVASEKEHCGGDVTMLLQDDGSLRYRCERCKRTWEKAVTVDPEKAQ